MRADAGMLRTWLASPCKLSAKDSMAPPTSSGERFAANAAAPLAASSMAVFSISAWLFGSQLPSGSALAAVNSFMRAPATVAAIFTCRMPFPNA